MGIVVITTLLTGLGTEFLLRYVIFRAPHLPNFFIEDAENPIGYKLQHGEYSYKHKDRIIHVSINQEGKRYVPDNPKHSSTEVIVIGDSQVFGWGLNDDETIPNQLQKILGASYSVKNWGLPGAGPLHMLSSANQLPNQAIPIFIFTEINDTQDSYSAKSGVKVHCHYLVNELGIGESILCPILDSQLFGLITDIRDYWTPQHLAPPMNCNPYAKSAAAVIHSRLNLIQNKLKNIDNALIFTIPWDAKSDLSRLKMYRPELNNVTCEWDFPNTVELKNITTTSLLFQNDDHHLSAMGAKIIATIIAKDSVKLDTSSKKIGKRSDN